MKIINNAFTQTIEIYESGKIIKGKQHDRDMVELDNGIWLQGYSDGRYDEYDESRSAVENERHSWASVYEIESSTIEEYLNGENETEEFLGYIKL